MSNEKMTNPNEKMTSAIDAVRRRKMEDHFRAGADVKREKKALVNCSKKGKLRSRIEEKTRAFYPTPPSE